MVSPSSPLTWSINRPLYFSLTASPRSFKLSWTMNTLERVVSDTSPCSFANFFWTACSFTYNLHFCAFLDPQHFLFQQRRKSGERVEGETRRASPCNFTFFLHNLSLELHFVVWPLHVKSLGPPCSPLFYFIFINRPLHAFLSSTFKGEGRPC